MQPSRWRSPRTTRRNQQSNANWYCDWQACCGASVGPPPLKVVYSRCWLGSCSNFGRRRRAQEDRQKVIEVLYRTAVTRDDGAQLQERANCDAEGSVSPAASEGDFDDLTRSFVRLSNLPNCPLDRLSRYEGTLWRQACQILFALQFLERRRPWERMRPRMRS